MMRLNRLLTMYGGRKLSGIADRVRALAGVAGPHRKSRQSEWRAQRYTRIRLMQDGFHVEMEGDPLIIRWEEIDGAVAVKRTQWVGHTMMVLFGLSKGGYLPVTQDDSCWDEMTRRLDALLPGAVPYTAWAVKLLDPSLDHVEVFRRVLV